MEALIPTASSVAPGRLRLPANLKDPEAQFFRRVGGGHVWRSSLGPVLAWLLILLCLGQPRLRSDVIQLTPAADTTLLESAPDFNMGAEWHMASGTTGSMADRTRNRGLLRFDLGSIPRQSKIREVTLTLSVTGVPGPDGGAGPLSSIFALHRVLRPWGEGTKQGFRGEFATEGEATWNHRFSPAGSGAAGQSWSKPGASAPADYSVNPSATQSVSGMAKYVFGSNAALVSDVQIWLDGPDGNWGWILVSQAETHQKTARRFGSREDPSNRPVLTVEFDPPKQLKIDTASVAGGKFMLQFTPQLGQSYQVLRSDSVERNDWIVLTNVPMAATQDRIVVSDPVDSRQRFYRVLQNQTPTPP